MAPFHGCGGLQVSMEVQQLYDLDWTALHPTFLPQVAIDDLAWDYRESKISPFQIHTNCRKTWVIFQDFH